jgi:hypothetical protein
VSAHKPSCEDPPDTGDHITVGGAPAPSVHGGRTGPPRLSASLYVYRSYEEKSEIHGPA